MKRAVTGFVLALGWVLLLLRSGSFFLFWLVTLISGLAALYEYMRIMQPAGKTFDRTAAIMVAGLPLFFAYGRDTTLLGFSLPIAFAAAGFLTTVRYASLPDPFGYLTRVSAALIMIGLFGAHLCLIMALPDGNRWLLYLTAITVCSDTAAYYCGTFFGSRKLCPAVSPKKTWEGLVGGIAGGVAAATLVAAFLLPAIKPLVAAGAAVLLAGTGVLGDLIESIAKRAAGVKDSSTFLPGHGGILDRIDSLLVTAPFLYYLLHYGLIL